jgi:hypothetical protein
MALAVVLSVMPAATSHAQDVAGARRDLAASDFRVRVSAALFLGRAHANGTRGDLENALQDPHPAVRAAAAAALRAYGDPAAVDALQRQKSRETTPTVQQSIERAISGLTRPASVEWKRAKYVVQLGAMSNSSGIRGDALARVLTQAARTSLGGLPGAIVADANDTAMLRQAHAHGLPCLGLDGTVTKVATGQFDGKATINARVEMIVRRMPDQSLHATLAGGATALASPESMTNQMAVASLQDQAVEGAVASALRGADASFARASAR